MSKHSMRLLSLILVFTVIFNLLPLHAMAAEAETSRSSPSVKDEPLDFDNDVYIVSEVASRRTEYSKEFILSNGLRLAAVYDNAVHYQENGQWKEIDNTLKQANTRSGNVYTNTAGSWQIAFPQSLTSSNGVAISRDQYTLSFRMSGELHRPVDNAVVMAVDADAELSSENDNEILSTIGTEDDLLLEEPVASIDALVIAENSDEESFDAQYEETVVATLHSKLEYPDIYENTDIIFELNSNQLKESVVINQFDASLYGYTYLLNVGDMVPVLTEHGQIELYDAQQQNVVMYMPAPYLVDDAGEYNFDVHVLLDELDGQYVLTYLLPQQWLGDSERAWPVILDPVVNMIASNTNAEDQTVYENTNLYMQHTVNSVTCGYEYNCRTMRFFMKYKELPQMSSGDVIVNATITLFMPESGGGALPIEIHRVTEEWSAAEITWNTQPAFDQNLVEDYAVCNFGQGHYTWDITEMVRKWYSGDNNGMVFKASDAVEAARKDNWKRFYSADFLAAEQPTLMITFRNNTGLESYWDYSSASAGRAGTVSVNNYTGNLVVSRADIGYGGNRMPVSIGFTYNANDYNTNIGYGFGWRMNYAQTITPFTTGVDQYYCWTDGDGTRIYFAYDSTKNKWIDENGLRYTLIIEDEQYTIKDRDNNSLVFNGDGYLTDIVDGKITGNAISISYGVDGKINGITDGAGRYYELTYQNGNLKFIKYHGSTRNDDPIETVTYEIEDGYLSKVTYSDGLSASYEYADGYLNKAIGCQGENIKVLYLGSEAEENEEMGKKVEEITVKDVETVVANAKFTYGKNYTTVTDHMGRWVTYQFNNFGNTVAVYNKQGQAVYGAYSSPTQLVSSSRLQDTVTNLLTDRTGTGNWSRTVSVAAGKSYTLSGTGVGTDAKTLSIAVNGVAATSYSVTTERAEVTIQVPEGTTQVTISGTGSFADLQLEQAEAASRYNMLLNTDMSDTSSWTGSGTSGTDGAALENTGIRANLNNGALKITGSPTGMKKYTQTLSHSGTGGDKYSFGLWVKGESVSLTNERDYYYTQHQRRFGVEVRLLNGSTVVAETYVAANDACSEWQFLSGSLQATGTYNKVEFSLVYDYNANTAYFDGAQLFLENFAYWYEYDELGRVETVTDLEGNVISYEYRGESSDVTKITYPKVEGINDPPTYNYTYDTTTNLLTGMTSATGIQTSLEYNTYGNNKKTVVTYAGNTGPVMQSNQTYTPDGNFLATVTGSDRNTVTYTYNTENSTLTSFRDAKGNLTSNVYDTMRRLEETTSGTAQVSYVYDNDRLLSTHHTGGTNGTTYRFTYTTGGLTDKIYIINLAENEDIPAVLPEGARLLVDNAYNANTWTLASQTYGNGQAWHYEYSDFDDLVRAWTTGGTTGTELRYFYNSEGALVRIEQYATTLSGGNGSDIELHSTITGRTLVSTERYYYDSANRATRIIRQDADNDTYECRWEYDHNNNVTNLIEVVNGQTHTSAYTYDLEQRISQFVNDGVTSGYTYDGFGRLSTQTNGALNKAYTFYNVQREEVQEDGSTRNVTYATSQIHTLTLDAANYDRTYTYTYDANGNILSVSDGTNTTSYVYDSLNQLVRENNQAAGKTWVYTYDNGGNITSRTAYAYTTARNPGAGSGPNAAPDVAYYTYGNTHWGDLLTAYKGQSITYDGIGNPLSDGEWEYTWENGRQLAAMESDTAEWTFKYNADGLRTERSNGTVTYDYIYSGSQLIQMTVGTDTLYFTYDASGTPMAVDFNGTKYFYATNLQGDIIAILDNAGNAVVEYTYNAWGNHLSTTGTMANTLGAVNPLRYRGYVYDRETALYYLQSRYYDPEISRFINADAYASTGQGILGNNMFAYCLNNPVNMVDSKGSFPTWQEIEEGIQKAIDWIDDTIVQPVEEFIEDVTEDFENLDADNQSEDIVFSSNFFSFYKGVLVVKTPFDTSFSFCIIGLSTRQQTADVLNHEYGHSLQLDQMGTAMYVINVAIPSVIINILDRQGKLPYDYYSYPWEAGANELGDSSLSQSKKPKLPQDADVSFWQLLRDLLG